MSLWPQYAILALCVIDVAVAIDKAGQPRSPYSAFSFVCSSALLLFILWKGGFFAGLGWAP